MDYEIVWVTPLLILPGIGLLIVSTSARFSSLHDEIHHWLDGAHDAHVVEQAHLVQRATHFRNALVALYLSVFAFVCASLVGAVLDFANISDVSGELVIFGIAILGIITAVFASSELIRESRLSLDVIRSHVAHIKEEMTHDQP